MIDMDLIEEMFRDGAEAKRKFIEQYGVHPTHWLVREETMELVRKWVAKTGTIQPMNQYLTPKTLYGMKFILTTECIGKSFIPILLLE